MAGTEGMRLPPLAPPRWGRVAVGLLLGVAGTACLYRAAARGSLPSALAGLPLFALGLYAAGWPFVLATAYAAERRRRPHP